MEKILQKFKNWKPIHLCKFFKKRGWKIPKYLIGHPGTEDLTTYTEVDPNSRVSKTATRVTWAATDRDETAYLVYDKTAAHFDGDFTHLCDARYSTGSHVNSYAFIWGISNTGNNDFRSQRTAGQSHLAVVIAGTGNFGLIEMDSANYYVDWSDTTFTIDTTYYLKIRRDESVGTYGTAYCDIYPTAADRTAGTNLIETLTVTLHTSKKDFQYIYAFTTWNDGSSGVPAYGYMENLDLQEVVSSSSSSSSCSCSSSCSSSSSFSSSSSCSSSFSSSSSSCSSSSSSACARQFGGNWQRKLWYNETTGYYWRGRYDIENDRFCFEYSNDLSGDNWIENVNARIDCSGFDAGAIDGDFTVRGKDSIAVTTIHYSDGIDTMIRESDEASATGWAWSAATTVFDGTSPDHYRKVNLCADREDPDPLLYASAVFYDDSEGTQYVVCKVQSASGDITGWETAIDISDNTNTNTIYGQSNCSMGETGAAQDDILFVYKEGDALKSQYLSGGKAKGIQTIDATTYSGRSMFDLEHGIEIGVKHGYVIYVDGDGAIKWRERPEGNTKAWEAVETLTSETANHESVVIVEHGNGLLYAIWREGALIKYRLHRCLPEIWSPALEVAPNNWDPSVSAVVNTTSVAQLQSPDSVPIVQDVFLCWIGEIAPDPCELGFGVLVDGRANIYSREKRLTLRTDDADADTPFIDTEYIDVGLDDDTYVQQCARDTLDPYGVFVWKDQHTTNKDVIISTCKLKASIAPGTSTVYLQIYNRNLGTWNTLAFNDSANADTEFTLSGTQSANLADYYDEGFWVAHRVYQMAA